MELAAPAIPARLGNLAKIGTSRNVPGACPKGDEVTAAILQTAPAARSFSSSDKPNDKYRFTPRLYPGGRSVRDGTFFFEPGIYWIGGSRLKMT